MSARRILSVWFPGVGVERLLRRMAPLDDGPFAVVRDTGQMQMQVLCSLSPSASAAGLQLDQSLRDALPGNVWQRGSSTKGPERSYNIKHQPRNLKPVLQRSVENAGTNRTYK